MSYNESLRANSNYPPMSQSEWDNAPWNQEDPPERTFSIAVSCSMSKDVDVTTSNYDGDDQVEEPWNEYTATEKTPSEVFEFAKEAAEYMLSHNDFKVRPKYTLKKIIDSCQGWNIDEENAEQN